MLDTQRSLWVETKTAHRHPWRPRWTAPQVALTRPPLSRFSSHFTRPNGYLDSGFLVRMDTHGDLETILTNDFTFTFSFRLLSQPPAFRTADGLCLDRRFFRNKPPSNQHGDVSASPGQTPTRNVRRAPNAEAFSPRTMVAADAGDKPTRLSATPARVRAQYQMKEKTKGP